MESLLQILPPELSGFALTLGLSLLIGFEREGHEPKGLGGVRTFPLIGLGGFLLVTAFPDSTLPFATGLVVVGVLIAISHSASVKIGEPGITTEAAAVLTFTIGAASARGMYWISIAAGVLAVVLLAGEVPSRGLGPPDCRPASSKTLVRFLVLTAVILPALPNQAFTEFRLNPFTLWLVVVAVSGVSYLSYLLQYVWIGGHGLLLTGILGGAYSSTVTTVGPGPKLTPTAARPGSVRRRHRGCDRHDVPPPARSGDPLCHDPRRSGWRCPFWRSESAPSEPESS